MITQQPSNCSKLIAPYIASQSEMIKPKYHKHQMINPIVSLEEENSKYLIT
jgi:hypothetical protein